MSRDPALDEIQENLLQTAGTAFCRSKWLRAESRRLHEQKAAYDASHPLRGMIEALIVDLDAARAGYDEALSEATETLMWTGVDLLDGTLAAFLNDEGWGL